MCQIRFIVKIGLPPSKCTCLSPMLRNLFPQLFHSCLLPTHLCLGSWWPLKFSAGDPRWGPSKWLASKMSELLLARACCISHSANRNTYVFVIVAIILFLNRWEEFFLLDSWKSATSSPETAFHFSTSPRNPKLWAYGHDKMEFLGCHSWKGDEYIVCVRKRAN